MLSGRTCDRLRAARERIEGFRELLCGVKRRSPARQLLLKRKTEAMTDLELALEEAYKEEMGYELIDHGTGYCLRCRFSDMVGYVRRCSRGRGDKRKRK